jgi:hypothetical protein
MLPIISGREGNRIKIEVTVELSGSMLEAEESILRAVNAVGNVATGEALKRFDADGDPIVVGGAKWYSKGKLSKIYSTPFGVVSAERHVYQPAEGGKTFCPMDDRARIIRKATPRFAKIVSHKFARGAAAQVVEDLEQNHGRPCLKASLQIWPPMSGRWCRPRKKVGVKRFSSVSRMAPNPIGIFLVPRSMSRCSISTMPVSTWRVLVRPFAPSRIASSGLRNNVTVSSTSIMRQRGFCATWSRPPPRK